jgi:acyl-CoA synthetase (AMP-forming)/AMP-acid ligase II
MANLAALFFEKAALNPDKTAIHCDDKTITYAALAQQVQRYSNSLSASGVGYREHIGFPMNNSIESAAMIFAAANIGAALVPINPSLPFDLVKRAFKACSVKHLAARKAFLQSLDNGKMRELVPNGAIICMDGEIEGAHFMREEEPLVFPHHSAKTVTGDETLIICLTSGSTGDPKPIDLTQNNKYIRAMAHINMYNLTENDNILAATPLYHSLAERLVIMPLILGGTCVLMPRFTPSLWLSCVREQNVTFTIAVSAQLSQVAELLSSPFAPELPHLRAVVSSSALLEPHIRNELIQKLECDFHDMYGTSETATATNIHFQKYPHKKNSVGTPFPEAELRIVLPDGQTAKPLEIGEIQCKSTMLCSGYYGMNDLFNEQLDEGYFKTGDMGYLDEEGFLYFVGRTKEIIITGGINVYPSDVEQCAAEIPEVRECAVFACPDERLVEVVAIAIVLKPGCELTKRAVKVHCARHLADFQQPHKIFFLEELPKNSMGKIMKTNLMEYIRKHNREDCD